MTAAQSPAGFTIDTIAGNGPPDVGDNRPARDAILEQPLGVLANDDGSFYIADTYNDRIRRVGADGIITTIAGNGAAENRDVGDGRPATQAQVRLPRAIKRGTDGALYIADTNYYRVRRIGLDGIISTVAGGNGYADNPIENVPARQTSFNGLMDIAFGPDGTLFIADSEANTVRAVGGDGIIRRFGGTGSADTNGDGGKALNAAISHPRTLAYDGRGGLLVGTTPAVRRIDLATLDISTVDGAAGQYVTAEADGTTYFVRGQQVYAIDRSSGAVRLFAGKSGSGFAGDGGPATEALIGSPKGISAGPGGTLFIADSMNGRVWRVANGKIDVVAGSGRTPGENVPARDATVYDSQGITVDARGNVYFCDFLHGTIRRINERGLVETVAGNNRSGNRNDGIHPLQAFILTPSSLIFDRAGNLLVLDQGGSVGVVRSISPGADGVVNGSADESIRTVAGQYLDRVQADKGRADGGPARSAIFSSARAMALDSQGRLFIADSLDSRIRMVVPGANGIFDGSSDEVITTIAGNGTNVTSGDGGPATRATLTSPGNSGAMAIDRDDNLYITEAEVRIRKIDRATGIIRTIHNRENVLGFAFAPDGYAYICGVTRIYRMDAEGGSFVTVAGGNGAGFFGDGGPAERAVMAGSRAIAIDARGDIYFPDNGNFRIRRLRR